MAIVPDFTEDQRRIIENFGKRQGVVAGAGCGKTATMVGKCVELLRRDPMARICAVSFTEKSALELAQRIEADALRQNLSWDRKRHRLGTLHGLCGAILREFPRAAGLEGGERILPPEEANPLWNAAIESLWWGEESSDVERALALLLQDRNVYVLTQLLSRLREISAFGAIEQMVGRGERPEVDALILVFQSVFARYKTAKKRRGGIDFQDLETLADLALGSKEVVRQFHSTYHLVIVDEFQDINPIQERIVRAIAKPEGTNLCVVGDPKQSIYRFRDADVSIFEAFVSTSLKFELSQNFRSRPEILEFVNQVCAPAFLGASKEYDALVAGRAFPPASTPPVGRLPYSSIEELAVALSKTDTRGLTILARSTGGTTTELLRQLRALKVPVLVQSGGKFWSDPRVQELIAFLKAWQDDRNILSAHAALRSVWIGIPDPLLEEWFQKGGASFSGFLKYQEHTLACAFAESQPVRESVRPGEVLEVLLAWDGLLEEMRMSVLQLWHRAENLSSAGRSFSEVVLEFERCTSDGVREREIPVPQSSDDLVLMTIHASKGLEFDRVLLLDFEDKTPRHPGGAGLTWHRAHGAFLSHRDPEPKSKEAEENAKWKEYEARERILESMRVLYVAITRPREKLYLYWPPGKDKEESERKPLYTEENWRRWVQATVKLEVQALPERLSSERSTALPTPGPVRSSLLPPSKTRWFRPRHSFSEWKDLERCEQLYVYRWLDGLKEEELRGYVEEPEEKDDPKERVPEGLSARERGSLLHQYLEFEDLPAIEEFDAPLAQHVRKIDAEHKLFGSFPKTRTECAFEVPLSRDEALVGVIDRLDWNPLERTARIVDYKWTQRSKDADLLIERYQKQLHVYAYAALKLLGGGDWRLELSLLHLSPGKAMWIPISYDDEVENWIGALWKKAGELGNKDRLPKKRCDLECKRCPFLEKCRPFS